MSTPSKISQEERQQPRARWPVTNQVTLEQTPKGTQKVSQADTWGNSVLGRGKSKGQFGKRVTGEFKQQRDADVAGMGLLGVGGRS